MHGDFMQKFRAPNEKSIEEMDDYVLTDSRVIYWKDTRTVPFFGGSESYTIVGNNDITMNLPATEHTIEFLSTVERERIKDYHASSSGAIVDLGRHRCVLLSLRLYSCLMIV